MSISYPRSRARKALAFVLLILGALVVLLGSMSWSEGSAAGPESLWTSSATPISPSKNDPKAVELGVKFQATTSGVVNGIRFYKGEGNTGAHTGSLWTRDGQLLARAVFQNETAVGWQQVVFDAPVEITANTTYVASYHTTSGRYAIDENYFQSQEVRSGSLYAPRSRDAGGSGNGVFKYSGSPAFPNETWNASNYWVDVVFQASTAPEQPGETPTSTPAPTETPVPEEPTPVPSDPTPVPEEPTPVPPEPTPTTTPEPPPPPSGTTNQPTIVDSYVVGNHDVYKYEWIRYQPRQFVSGKRIDPVGNDVVSNPGNYQGWDVLNAPDPPDSGSAGFFGRVYGTSNLFTVTLNRPADMAIVWMAGNQTPNWLSSWTPAGTVSINNRDRQVFRKSVPAGSITLGGMYDSGTGSTLRPGYYVLSAESGGVPSAQPAVPAGQTVPAPNETCPGWVHDQYVAVGPDGQTYPTWHPQVDRQFWCYFGHEHGSDPAHFDGDYKPLFGYTASKMGMNEPHAGFKVYVGSSNGYTFLVNHHFGTGGLARACVRHHTFDMAMKNSSGQLVADVKLMADFGPALFNRTKQFLTPSDCPNQGQEASGSTGVRQLPSAHDHVGYEPWRVGNGGNAVGLRGTITINTFDSMIICNNTNCDTPVNTGDSGTKRAIEEFYNVGIRNSPNTGTFFTDPLGNQTVDQSNSGAVQQYVAPGASVDMGRVVCRDFTGWGYPYTCGANVGTQPIAPTERENSIVHPN